MRRNPLVAAIFALSALSVFLLIASEVANWRQREVASETITTVGNVTQYTILYPDWFFQLLTVLTLLTFIGLSSILSSAFVQYAQRVGGSSGWGPVSRLGVGVAGEGMGDGAGLVQWGFSLTALYSAIAFVGYEGYMVASQGAAATIGYVSILPEVKIMGVSVILFGAAYIFLILPRYGMRSVWVLGMMWGFAECVWNSEIALIHFPSIASDFSTPWWAVYIALVSSLFLISTFFLRNQIRRDRLGIALVGAVLAFTPVRILVTSLLIPSLALGVPVPLATEVVTSQLPWYFLILVATWGLVRRTPHVRDVGGGSSHKALGTAESPGVRWTRLPGQC